ncbi:MAG: glycosyltransferase family 39 protein [Candidatus Roizmanbacteria bacterium]|nr:glycosyltransferase family 39 protein [Candidatus Roizmanbacteria bacterium]
MKNKFYILLTALIFFILTICNFIWLKIDIRPPHWDFAIHLSNIFDYFDLLEKNEIISLITYFNYHPPQFNNYYPPLSYYLTISTYKLFGIGEDIAVLSLTPFLAIIIFSIYKIGQTLKNNKLGFLMVVSLVGMPFLMSQTREYQLDFPLTAMVSLNLYLFLKTNLFKNRKFSIIFGLVSGLAMLTKWTYSIFFIGILITGMVFVKKKNSFIIFKNYLIVFVMMLIISGPWYINNLPVLKQTLGKNITIAINEHDPNILTKESSLWYANSIYKDHLRFPLLIFNVVGLIYLIKDRKKLSKILQLTFISLFYLLIMTLYRNKDPRFIEPLTPIFSIFACFWILELKNSFFRKILIISLILLSAFNYYSASFGFVKLPIVLESRFLGKNIIWFKQYGYTLGPPKKENWHLKEIFNEMTGVSKRTLFLVNEDKMFLNIFNILYYQRLFSKYLIGINVGDGRCKNTMINYYYLVVNDIPESKLLNECKIISNNFYKNKEFYLPDNSVVVIFKKKIY